MPGTYTLLIDLDRAATVAFGAAGERDLVAGRYAYTGSAFGPGGFGRLDRHRAVARGDNDARHWHVDHLLGHPPASVTGDVRSAGERIECAVAARIADAPDTTPVPGIGASDCDCATHLVAVPGDAPVRRAHADAR